MEIDVHSGRLGDAPADAVVAAACEGEGGPGAEALTEVDRALGGTVARLRASGEWTGAAGRVAVLHGPPGGPFERVALVGLGPAGSADLEAVRSAAAAGVRALREHRARAVALSLVGPAGSGPAEQAEAAAVGALLGLYRFQRYRSRPEEGELASLHLVAAGGGQGAELARRGLVRGRILGEAVALSRDLSNEPGGSLPPRALAQRGAEAAREAGLEVEVLDEAVLEERGFGALLGVGRGSAEPPRLITMRYRCGRPDAPLLALVGKGVTFDAGGLSLKTADGMVDMKHDKSGACDVIAALRATAALRPAVDVVGVCPLVENLTGGRAQKPGDVLRTLSGKTVEVLNTDAEGRLILADAVAHACRLGARWVVDIATLTGAVVIALGHQAAGLVANDDGLREAVGAAAADTGERVWALPAYPEYREQYRSEVADLKNVGGRPAGAITAALIIGEFVAPGVAWAHLDVAGVAWLDKDRPLYPKGATGFGTRLMVRLAERLAAAAAESAAGPAPGGPASD